MQQAQSFRSAVAELQLIQAAIVEASGRTDDGWKHALIDLRRRLQVQITEVSDAIKACAAISADPEAQRSLSQALSRMRSAVALHQARWPAVQINRGDPGYLQSVAGVRAANEAFLAEARRVMTEFRI